MDSVVDAVKVVAPKPLAAFLDEVGGAVQHPRVDFLELMIRQRIARSVEITEIAQGEAEGVADLAVGFAELRHDALAHFHVGLVFHRRNPETKQVCAPLLGDLRSRNNITKMFGHWSALLDDSPAALDQPPS